MSASHSPAIGDKPIKLLTNAGTVRFWAWFNYIWAWLKKFARALCAHLIVTKLYIARASPVVKSFLRPCNNQEVSLFQNPTAGQWCLVSLLDMYFSKIYEKAKETDTFYCRPLDKYRDDDPWYSV